VGAIDRLTLPTEAERVHDLASHQLERCKQSIVRLLGSLEPGACMSRTVLSRALRSDVRAHIETAISELVEEGAVLAITTDQGRAYQPHPEKTPV
jgi:integrase/recombinase XerD